MRKFLLISFSIFLLQTANLTAKNSINLVTNTPEKSKISCLESNGDWQMLNDGCADKCFRYEKPGSMCTMAFTEGCNCGPSRCFDHQTKSCRAIKMDKKDTKPYLP